MSQFLSLVTSLRFAEFDFGLIIAVAEATCNDLCFSSLLDFVSPQFKDCSRMLLHFEDLRKLLVHLEHEVVRKYFLLILGEVYQMMFVLLQNVIQY